VRSLRSPVRGGITDREAAILRAQIEDFRPNVILNQEPHYHSSEFLGTLRRPGIKIAGQIASELPAGETFQAYDLMFSSLPNIVDWIRGQGVRAEMVRLGFEPTILEALGPQPARDIGLSFVGSLSPHHAGRIEWLEYLARRAPLKLWGSGIHLLPKTSPLHACHQGEAWGRGMYEVLRRSRITLNNHIDLAEGWANNMRLYEATGMDTALLTDAKKNLHEIFAPGEEVATYTTPQDCLEQVQALLADEDRRAAIAAAGQRRAIESHSYFNRTREMADILKTL
jgi:spore maturation protein CgeB